ncbi:MAG: D-alanyl-D-alanine carboxypeptidase family protein [Eubacteriales bacterium]
MKKIIAWIMLLLCFSNQVYAEEEDLQLYAQSAVLMDGESGRILFEENGYSAMANASTTKILTCILALEYGDLSEVVVASAEAASQPAVHMGVSVGEEYVLEDLLYALMLESYNDSAVMIAESVSGSVEAFAQLMNEKAEEIGCEDSYFITPNGLDAEDDVGFHHTTASDLATIMKYCIMDSTKSEEFLAITQTLSYSFSEVNGSRSYTCTNHNTLLQTNENAISGKTGFTNDAGYCYVGAIESEGRTFIIALLGCGWPYNSTYKWSDSSTLFDYATENYYYTSLESSEYTDEIEQSVLQDLLVENAKTLANEYYTDLFIVESDDVEVLVSDWDEIDIKIEYPEILYAPVDENTLVGSVIYTLDDTVLKVDSILTNESIEQDSKIWKIYKKFTNTLTH